MHAMSGYDIANQRHLDNLRAAARYRSVRPSRRYRRLRRQGRLSRP